MHCAHVQPGLSELQMCLACCQSLRELTLPGAESA